jgi:lipid-A-disaccharide synthase
MSRPYCVMLVAAEASGDVLGAGLARALRRRLGEANVRFVGVGGAAMAAEGVQSPFDIGQLSILGLFEGLMAYPKVLARVRDAAALAAREKPDIAVLIDSWGFTLRVAKALRAADPAMKLVKYVAPQVWASRPGRAKTLAGAVDHLLSTQAMDAPFFEKEGLPTTFVGNAGLARDLGGVDPVRLRTAIGAGPSDPILLVLPGSRPAEIERVMPVFEDAARRLKADRPDLRILVPAASTVTELVRAGVAAWSFEAHLIEDEQSKFDAMAAATVALACSGSVTTELALAGCPMVVGYKIGPVSYSILRFLIRTRYATLFNIAAQEAIAPEFIQNDCTGEKLAASVAERLDDPDLRMRQVAAQNTALLKMGRGGPDPAEKAAEVVAGLLGDGASLDARP